MKTHAFQVVVVMYYLLQNLLMPFIRSKRALMGFLGTALVTLFCC